MTKVELGGAYQTRDGHEVRIAMIDAGGEYPVRGFLKDKDGHWVTALWTAEGSFLSFDEAHPRDLIECKPKHVRWVNCYPNAAGSFPTRERADEAAGPSRIACVRIEFEEGEGLS